MSPHAYLVDDDEAIRDSLGWLLESRGVACVSYPSAEDFLAAWSPALAGCLLLDIRMDGMSGPELFDILRERGSRLPVIFLTGHGDVPMAVSALKKGAFDFVEKPCNDNELVNRVIEALKLDANQRAAASGAESVNTLVSRLTTREQQVMELILAGKLNKVIADELQVSMRTVEVHRANLFEKMGVRTAVELAQLLAGKR
ncbi:response regulator [Accumulibacter sp.]|jgi:two-component system response regulator DctR|uniref:response regulator transcription factor n=1 Tax=Accumulibacter sp. TaxID=2053492 RepID=UPI002BE228B5|nr:response regulator [Accumulibacter sp.]HPU80919.1 response regulator [Accumulibacter sp.]